MTMGIIIMAVGGAMAWNAITGDAEGGRALLEASGVDGGTAVLAHTVIKNAVQFIKD